MSFKAGFECLPTGTSVAGQSIALTQFVAWSHRLTAERLRPGDLAVDLTAGRGRDTLCLAQAVGSKGRVVAFDIQRSAVDQTLDLLTRKLGRGLEWPLERAIPEHPGIYVIHGCHTNLERMLTGAPRVIMANLGYLPGGDRTLTTLPESSRAALGQAAELLVPGGRLVVIGYPAHAGGAKECAEVEQIFAGLDAQIWDVLKMVALDRPDAPFLMAAERRN